MTTALTNIVEDLALIFGSTTLAFLIALALTPWFHKQLIKFKIGKQIRDEGFSGGSLFSTLHAKKSGTPTMGGILIWSTIFIVVALSMLLQKLGIFDQSLFSREETWIPLFTLLTCGILGAIDDYLNVKGIGKHKGISAKLKMFWLVIFSAAGAWWFYSKLGYNSIGLPIPGMESWEVGIWYIPIFIFIIIATANSVNFTDGLDGLASGPLLFAFGSFGILAYTQGLLILAALCGVICGAVLAFLWFNVPPALFYMGDTGSLALGATLGVTAMLVDQALILPIVGFIFVVETLSIIIQLSSKKFLGRKVFHIAPIHHHFEHIGWKEYTVVMRFWIIGGIMAGLGTILGLINIL